MATLTTKFDIGDVVYFATTSPSTKRLPCPDCLDTRQWQAISPGGRGYLFGCPRCNTSYQSNRDLSLDVRICAPHVARLTIGQVGWNNDPWKPEKSGPQYMCNETGIGSGSCYYEADLFGTEEEALRVAEAKAAEATQEIAESPRYYNEHLKVADYQLEQAVVKSAERKQRDAEYSLQYLIEELIELATDASDGYPELTPSALIKIIEKRCPNHIPDDLEHKPDGKVHLKECVC